MGTAMDIQGSICVVTGASSGLGRQTAIDLAKDGATVCVVARREELLQELIAELSGAHSGGPHEGSGAHSGGPHEGSGAPHSYVTTDVSDRSEVQRLAATVEERYGRLDVLVNNAGFSRGRAFEGPASVEDVEMVMQTNFLGTVYCCAEFLPLLERSAPSSIVNVASIAGRMAFGNASAYCASKFAVVGWSEAARFDLEKRDVHLSLVEPGPIPTDGFSQEALVEHPLLKYALGTPSDVSQAIRDAIRKNKAERVVPRWYYLAQIPRIITPPLYRQVVKRMVSHRVPKEQKS